MKKLYKKLFIPSPDPNGNSNPNAYLKVGKTLFVLLLLITGNLNVQAQFTPGNLVVVRVGGGAALSNAATQIAVTEYTTAGVLGGAGINTFQSSTTIPAVGVAPFLNATGNSNNEGFGSTSLNGAFFTVLGYNITNGTAAANGAASNNLRAIGNASASATLSIPQSALTLANGQSLRGVISDGTDYWVTSGNTVAYVTGSTVTSLLALNTRCIGIYNGQLFYSTGSGTQGVYPLGTGIPTSASAAGPIVGASTNPNAFCFNPTHDILYIADEGGFAAGGGIRKYTRSGSTWSLAYTLNNSGAATTACRGLIVDWSGANPIIYATVAAASNNAIIRVTDNGSALSTTNPAGTAPTTIVAGTTNIRLAGVAFAPGTPAINLSALTSGTASPATVAPFTTFANTYSFGSGPIATSTSSFLVRGYNLGVNNVTVVPPTNFEVSTSASSGFTSGTLNLPPTAGSVNQTVYVRLAGGLAANTYSGNVTVNTTGCPQFGSVAVSGEVQALLPPVNLSVDLSAGTEAGTTVVTLTATTSSAVSGNQTVDVVASGTGITAGDYSLTDDAAAPGIQIEILNGATTGTITFTIVDDALNEGTETATLTISNPQGGGIILGSTLSQNVTITDDDDAIQLNTLNVAEPTITFDDLANSGTNSLTIKGAYLFETTGNTTYGADNGSSNTGNTFSYGTTLATDRALGSLASGGNNPLHVGLKLTNTTGGTINAIDLTYTGEQWRNGGNTSADILFFQYSTDATSLSTGTWNTINAMNMVSLQNTITPTALDGNNPANRTTLNGIIGLGAIANNGSVWIRWRDENQGGNDHGMGVDDVIITPLFITPSIFYSKSTGDLNVLGTWGDNTDGSGNAPANFTAAGQTFNIVNQTNATISAGWTVSGGASEVVVGNGVAATTFTVPSGSPFTASVDVSANATLELNDASAPTFGTINSNSTITFGATFGTQNVDATTYGNLNFVGAGVKNITGPCTVTGDILLDGATMNKSAAGFVNINYAGNITILNPCTYNPGFITNVSFVTSGNGNQVITGNGNLLSCSQFNCLTKTAGSLTLSLIGGSSNVTTQDDIKMNLPAGVTFTDNGNTLSVGGDFETAGQTASYLLTGTLSMDGFPAAPVNIRLDGAGGSGVAGVAEINNLVINCATSTQFNFQPLVGAGSTTIIKGNLTIQGGSSYSNGIRFGSTTPSNVIRILGNYNNTLNANVINAGTGTLEFGGSAGQNYSTAFSSGDAFYNVLINNPAGVTMTSGDLQITSTGNLNCSSGILTTGSNRVILTGTTSTMTESSSSYVVGFVRTTRNIGSSVNQPFGGIGFEINAAGAANSTLVERETGTSITMGCPAASLRRIFTVTPTTNAGLNATLVYRYLNSVAELNGINENFINLFDGAGNLISNLGVLNTGTSSITVTGQATLASSYTATIPGPTLGGVSISQPYVCAGSTGTVDLTGLLANGTFTINYTINGINQAAIVGLTSDNSGNGSFSSPALTNAQNGTLLEITNITQTPISCAQAQSNSVVLDVRPRPTVSISANDFVCVDQTAPINFFLTGTGPWNMQHTINGGAPIINNGIATSPQNYPYALANIDRTYVVTSLSDANCVANPGDLTTHFIAVPNPCSVTWGGASSPDWTDGANWLPNNSAPSQFTSVVIPKVNAPNFQPVVNGVAVCADVNLSNTPTINVAAGNQLTIRGNINGGQLGGTIGGLGKVVMSGTGLQSITNRVMMSNLDLANVSAQGVVINPNSSLEIRPTAATGSGLVTFLNNARLTNNGKFVLGSSPLATAKIGPMPATFTMTGNVTIERYLPYTGGIGSWNFIGSPFTGANFTDLSDNFKVVGLTTGFGPQGGGIINGSANEPERATIFKYDEPSHDTRLDTVQKQGWRIPGNENIIPGTGYRVWVDHYSNGSHKFDNTGALVHGNFSFPTLNRNELAGCVPATFPCDEPSLRGWNLLANPYPCDINWDAAGWTKPVTMSDAWYRWHASANGYGVYASGIYAGTSPEPTNPNLIPSNQAFFVRLSTAGTYTGTLSVTESAKVTSSAGQFVRTNVNTEKVRVTLAKPGVVNGYSTVVRFKSEATDGFDLAHDFASMGGSGFHISVPVENTAMSIATFAPVSESKVIPVSVNLAGQTGNFQLSFTEMETLLENHSVFVRDNLLGTIEPLTEGSVYAFSVTPFDGAMSNRFELIFNPSTTTTVLPSAGIQAGLSVFPNPSTAGTSFKVVLNGFEGATAEISITDVLARTVAAKSVALVGQSIQTEISDLLPAGVYTIKAKGKNQTITRKLVVR